MKDANANTHRMDAVQIIKRQPEDTTMLDAVVNMKNTDAAPTKSHQLQVIGN